MSIKEELYNNINLVAESRPDFNLELKNKELFIKCMNYHLGLSKEHPMHPIECERDDSK